MLHRSIRDIIVIFLMCLGINTTYAEEYVKIIQLGEFETSYTADFTGKNCYD